jgi:hypothetical protein
MYWDRSAGFADYNALQVELNKRFTNGLSYQVSYTYSKAMSEDDGWFGVEGTNVQNPYDPAASRSASGFDLPHVLSINSLYEIPVGKGKRFSTGNRFADYVLGNWQINNLITGRSGQTFTPILNNPPLLNTGNTFVYLDKIGDPGLSNRGPQEWFNTSAYAAPPAYQYGTAGRNSLRSQRYWDLTSSVIRQFPFWGERRFEFRAEGFNLFNHPVFATPVNDLSNPNFGQVTPQQGNQGMANYARELQMSLKIIF